MNISEIKKMLLAEIENCNDKELLTHLLITIVEQETDNTDAMVSETEIAYKNQSESVIPQAHWDLLIEQREQLKRGEIVLTSWEDFKKSFLS